MIKTNRAIADFDIRRLAAYALVCGAIFIFGVSSARAATYTVTNTNDSGAGSLRQAITQANASAGVPDVITFSVPASSVITPGSPLPTITDQVTIGSGTRVELNGASAGETAYGLRISAANCVVTGMAITRFQQGGIRIDGAANNTTVQGTSIGTNLAGTAAFGNVNRGILIVGTTGNLIGGGGIPNIISGNQGRGIEITAGGAATIRQNYIGTNAAGTGDLGNLSHGVQIVNSSGSTVGSTTPDQRNVISGNNGSGIVVIGDIGTPASNNTIINNYIGVNVSGNTALPNNGSGIVIQDANNVVGGANHTTLNAMRNVISGNLANGVTIASNLSAGNAVQGNYIGVGANGTTSIPNRDNGVQISNQASGNTVGGTSITPGACSGACNVIANNGDALSNSARAGIYLDITAGVGNTLSGNSTFGNAGIGIDLDTPGANPNDAFDLDTGANNRQNAPVLTNAGDNEFIVGTFTGAPNAFFRLDFYINEASDVEVIGMQTYSEGRIYIGSTIIQTGNAGSATLGFLSMVQLTVGQLVTATATSVATMSGSPDPNFASQGIGDTSEGSNAQPVVVGGPTAALVSISGRINSAGRSLKGVSVTLFDTASGETFYATTDINGGYRFNDVPVGEDYILTPQRIGYTFNPSNKFLSLIEELADVDFTAVPDKGRRRF